MTEVLFTDAFDNWLYGLKDKVTIKRLENRLDKVSRGLLGDVKSVGKGVYEMREHFGAGYRMYYIEQGQTIILMLGGGDKSSQKKDIELAQALAKKLEE